jgi:hypothetical protein
VCARWLGVRKFLRADGSFGDAPPPSVALWQRYLSYGVALGVAHATATALPFEREDPHHAWSRYGGNWHQVRVDYPHRFGYGDAPLGVFLGGVVRTLFWGALSVVVVPFAIKLSWRAQHDVFKDRPSILGVGLLVAFVVIFGVITIQLVGRAADGAIRLARGARDLRSRDEVQGAVVRIDPAAPYAGYFAIDNGRDLVTRAFKRAPSPSNPELHVGDEVKVSFTPHLRHVSGIEVIGTVEHPGTRDTIEATPSRHLLDSCDAEALQRCVGVALQPIETAAPPTGTEMRAFTDNAGHGRVLIAAGNTASPAIAMLIRAALDRNQTERVAGLGTNADWNRDRLVVRTDLGAVLLIVVDLPTLPDPQRRAAATAIARLVMSAPTWR